LQESSAKPSAPLLLVDESLSANPLAVILRLLDYNAKAVTEQFGQGVEDPTLIRWLGLQGGIWITADEKAKRQHADEIMEAGIHIVWVRRSKEGMGKKDQALLLLWVIDTIVGHISRARKPTQFLAYFVGRRPKLLPLP
jgi:hypothetical protein